MSAADTARCLATTLDQGYRVEFAERTAGRVALVVHSFRAADGEYFSGDTLADAVAVAARALGVLS